MSIRKSKARKLAEFLRNITAEAKLTTEAVQDDKVVTTGSDLDSKSTDTTALVSAASVTSYVGDKLDDYVHSTHDINLTFTGDVTGHGTITDMGHTSFNLTLDAETLPNQSGYAGKFLTTDGTTASWATVDTTDGDTAYSWGDHAQVGYLTSETNDYVDSVSFSTSSGVLRLGRTGSLSDLTVDLDGRYLQSFTESDTLQSVTARGASTDQNILIEKNNPVLTLSDTNANPSTYPTINFTTTNNQGVNLYYTEFDSELPLNGYGLVLDADSANAQFPDNVGAISLNVLGEVYAGSRELGTLNKVWHAGNLDPDNYLLTSNYVDTTYNVSAVDVSGGKAVRLTGSDGTTDDVKFAAGSNVSLARSGDTITISSTDTNTDTNTTDWYVANSSGGNQFKVDKNENVRFEGTGATSVSFNASNNKITISSTDTNTETTTNLVDNGDNTITYTNEEGTAQTIDLSLYLDDTNLARILSGTMNSSGVATFTRDDDTTFTVDMSVLLDDTNLSRITSASWNTSNGVLTLTRNDNTTVAVDLDNRYLTSFDITTQTDAKYLRSDVADTTSSRIDFRAGITSQTLDIGYTGDRTIQALSNDLTFGTYGDLHLQHYGGDLHMVHGGGIMYDNGNRVFSDRYHPNADKWTTARTNTVTLTGDVTGSGSASVDGSGNWTVSVATDLNVASTDTFTGTYPIAWLATDNLYKSTWLTINGATDTLNTRNINANGTVTATNFVGSINYSQISNPPTIPDVSVYVRKSGDTMSGTLVLEDSELHVGDKSADSWTRFKHGNTSDYGVTTSHGTASIIVNEQGGLNQFLLLGDTDAGGLFAVGQNRGGTWNTRLNLNDSGELYVGNTGTSRVWHDGYHPVAWSDISGKPPIDNSVDYINGASFSTSTGVLTLSGVGRAGATVDLDGRYLTSYSETDTLQTVTNRGNTTTHAITANHYRYGNGDYARRSVRKWVAGRADNFSNGSTGWKTIAKIRLTTGCSGDVLYGNLYEDAYHDARVYQIAVVARAECNFTSDNESHVIEVGCTTIAAHGDSDYRNKIRVSLVESSTNSRTYELQIYETPWNSDKWELTSRENSEGNNLWTKYTSGQTIGTATGTPRVSYSSRIQADSVRANTEMRAPVFYDSDSPSHYADFANSDKSVVIAGKYHTNKSTGTIASIGSISDAVGHNSSYGTYIGGTSGSYLYHGTGDYPIYRTGSTNYQVWTSKNFNPSSYSTTSVADGRYVRKTGDTMTGPLTVPGVLKVTETGTAQHFLIGNQDSGGVNKPAMIRGVNGQLQLGHGSSWSGEGGSMTVGLTVSGPNIGIGTTGPAAKLHLYTGGVGANTGVTDMMRLELNRSDHSTTPSGPAILFKDQDSNNNINEARIKMMTVNATTFGDNDEAASNFIFETTNGGVASDKMIITGRGDIGMGTNNPKAPLHVTGNVKVGTTNGSASSTIVSDLDRFLEVAVQDGSGSGQAANYTSGSGIVFHHGGTCTSAIKHLQPDASTSIFRFDSDRANTRLEIEDGNTRVLKGSSNSLKVQTNSGYIEIGPKNTSHCHITTDRSNFYFDEEVIVDSGIIGSYNEDLQLRRARNSAHQIRIAAGTTTISQNTVIQGNLTVSGSISQSDGFGTLYTFNTTQALSTSWADVSAISGSTLPTGTYAIQIKVYNSDAGGGNYDEHYSGTMAWYGSGTNDNDSNEIPLHNAGHAYNGAAIYARTLRRYGSAEGNMILQLAASGSISSDAIEIKIRRLI